MHRQTCFFHTNGNECVCYQTILMIFYLTLFTFNFLTLKKNIYTIINNEYKSMVFAIFQGYLPYSND